MSLLRYAERFQTAQLCRARRGRVSTRACRKDLGACLLVALGWRKEFVESIDIAMVFFSISLQQSVAVGLVAAFVIYSLSLATAMAAVDRGRAAA